MKVRKLAQLGSHRGEGFVNTGWRDVEGMSDLADRPSSFPKAFDLSMIYPQTWPPQPLAFAPGIHQPCLDAFPNDGSLKFSKGSEQMKE